MDLVMKNYHIHQSQALSPIKSPPSHSHNSSFPILAVAIIGILATAFLLLSYYIFVIKCCLNWHRVDLLSRFSFSRNRTRSPIGLYSPRIERRGLDESVIQSIPVLQFTREIGDQSGERGFSTECAVCLNEFQLEEKLRVIPNCSHVFHVDCIDVWLQSNINCPLCRTSISTTPHFPIIAPRSSPHNPLPNRDNFSGRDEDYVVIELGGGEANSTSQTLLRVQERLNSGDLSSARSVSPSPRKTGPKIEPKKPKRTKHVSSMGDECIDIRKRDDQFAIQPIRRSFSMDSASDRQLYLAVQEIIQQNRQPSEVSFNGGCGSSRFRRSIFSFGNAKGPRSVISPIGFEP